MLYRQLGRTGEEVSILGFGCMRLPILDGRRDHIDVPLATKMLHHAIESGVNYVDTAFPYHGTSFQTPGASETFVGEALAGDYRDRVMLATKLPPWVVKSRGDMDTILAGQLERLQTDHIDCYLLHGLNPSTWKKIRDLGALEFLDSALADGRIRYAGFSFHDEVPVFKEIVDAYDWSFCQIQYNYMDEQYQAGLEGLRYAASRGLGVVVMEPLKGGRLAGRTPAEIQALWDSATVKRSPADWALRFVWNDPGVSTVLSGMGNVEQVVANIAAAEEALPDSLTTEELDLVDRVRQAYLARTVVGCTGCEYCLPCPSGINIPLILTHLNNASLFDDPTGEKGSYHVGLEMGATKRATECTRCGQCEEACPQNVPVADKLEEASHLFD
ncbi:MAG TPA: aldo/keto reductase [Thermoleophilia bacterium]